MKNWNDGATGMRKKFDDISSFLDIIYTNVCDRQTDRWMDEQTDTGRQQKLGLLRPPDFLTG